MKLELIKAKYDLILAATKFNCVTFELDLGDFLELTSGLEEDIVKRVSSRELDTNSKSLSVHKDVVTLTAVINGIAVSCKV